MSGSVLSFILLGFGAPAFISQYSGRVVAVLTVIVFWFLVGALISRLARKNIIAIGVWLLVYVISLALSLAIFAEINN